MLVIAQRQLRGVYGLVTPGEKFDAPDDVAAVLLKRGLAVPYETKDIVPAEQPARTSRRAPKPKQV